MRKHAILLTTSLLFSGLANAGASGDDLAPKLGRASDEQSRPAPSKVLRRSSGSGSASDTAAQGESAPAAFQIYASDKSAELLYERQGSVLGLNNSHSNVGIVISEERDSAVTGAVMFNAQPEFLANINFAFGLRGYVALLGQENNDIFGVGANIEASYELPIDQLPLQLSAEFGYVPDILAFGQADRIFDWNVRAGLALTDNVDAFVGFRFLQFDTRPGDQELDDHVHLGITWRR